MFKSCTSLTEAPELPATTLADWCYSNMFKSCKNLGYIKMLATTFAPNCLDGWVSGVASTGTFIKHPDMDSLPTGESGIPSGWTVENYNLGNNEPKNYFTIESLVDNNGISFSNDIDYSYDGINWNSLDANETIYINANEKVKFKKILPLSTSESVGCFVIGSECNVKGNIMSLIHGDNFENKYDLTERDGCFESLFSSCPIVDASELILPATTLSDSCYSYMFYGCTSLTSAPALPATTLTDYCYDNMFESCTSLTAAPELPATTLAYGCYNSMFMYCESLTAAPELPATTLTYGCYNGMFMYCGSLTEAPALPATTLATNCYYMMFYYCISLTTAPELPATTLAYGCYNSMFMYCESLTAAPELPATTLTYGCYNGMFMYCGSLTEAPALPATTLATNCYYMMFYYCISLTTAPELPATTLAESCYDSMFYGCTSLTSAPELPATTLADWCYYGMFNGCSELDKIAMLATDISAPNCLDRWVSGVASTGTFIKHPDMNSLPTGESGIPEGWTVEDYNVGNGEPKNYFTIESLEDENGIFLTYTDIKIDYSFDGNEWLSNFDNVFINKNDKIYFKCNTLGTPGLGVMPIGTFKSTGKINVKGNIMSLIHSDDFENKYDLTVSKRFFQELFYDNVNIVDASELLLPATTLAESCYDSMFYGCTSLTSAPALPATTLANYCYNSMFYGCTSLTEAPVLPATTLADWCYYGMFNGCSELDKIAMLATDISAPNCLNEWVTDVSYSGIFTKHQDMTSLPTGVSGIPSDWIVQDYESMDVAYYDGSKIKTIAVESYNDTMGELIGIVVIPYNFLPDGNARILSLYPVDANGKPCRSNYSGVQGYINSNNHDSPALNYQKLPITTNKSNEISGYEENGFLPSDSLTGEVSYIDQKSRYTNGNKYGAGFCPSPYLGDSLNPNYLIYKFDEYKNAFNNFDGLGNTTILSENSDYLAANGAWRYKDGSTSSQWYLPSIGELAIIFARINNINITLKILCKQIIKLTLWSSTDNGSILLPLSLDGNIWHTIKSEIFYNNQKEVRPITMLELITFTIDGTEYQAEKI